MPFKQLTQILIAIIAIVLVAILDYLTGYEISFSIFYLGPIIFLSWYTTRTSGLIACVACAILWTVLDLKAGHVHNQNWIPIWNGLVRLGFFTLTSLGVSFVKKQFEIQQAANDELQRLSKVKSEFTSMVSHELRTPLTVIKESIRIIYSGTTGAINSEQKDFLETAKRNIDRLVRLINDVLDLQKLESKNADIRMTENNINELVNEIKNSFGPTATAKSLKIIVDLEKKLPLIILDRDKIIQVMTNLVGNAIKVMEKGKITLKTRRLQNAVRVSVQDDGPGIKEEDMPKLFLPFSQLDMGLSRKTGSSGLGLAISKQIIDEHKGKIGVESSYGKGSTFYFLLTIAERRNSKQG